MPEDLSLPGIDPAPAAPAAPTPPPAPEDTATQSASVDTGAPAPPDGPPAEPPEVVAQKREARGVQKRLNELTEERRIERERADRNQALLEKVVTGMLAPQQAQPAAADEAAPRKEDFASWDDFNRAEARYIARQEAAQFYARQQAQADAQRRNWETQQAQAATHAAVQQLEGVVGTQLQEAATRYPDYIEVIESCPVKVPVNVQAAMAMSGQAGDVGYYLARNPALIGRLAQLPDMALAYQVNRIAGHMRSNSATVSNAPAPGRPVAGRGSGQLGYPENATPQQHMAWRKAQAARK